MTPHHYLRFKSNTHTYTCVHTHTYNGPFSGSKQVSQYQKGNINLDFNEARDSEWQWHQLGHMQVCTCSRQITMPALHRSIFYRPDALPAAKPTASKHWMHNKKQFPGKPSLASYHPFSSCTEPLWHACPVTQPTVLNYCRKSQSTDPKQYQ